MKNLILNLCIYLDNSREEQCYKFINQFYDNDKFIDAWIDKASIL